MSGHTGPTHEPRCNACGGKLGNCGCMPRAGITSTPRREAYAVTEYEIHTQEPESLSVGQLNRVVRELREALYQQKLLTQDLGTVVGALRLDCGDNSCHFAKNKRGMRTNGGCRCLERLYGHPSVLKNKPQFEALMRLQKREAGLAAAAIAPAPECGPETDRRAVVAALLPLVEARVAYLHHATISSNEIGYTEARERLNAARRAFGLLHVATAGQP